jgi:uncharacterized protein with HEPN domain
MPRVSVAERLGHILDAISRVETYTTGRSLHDYLADCMLRDAVEAMLRELEKDVPDPT